MTTTQRLALIVFAVGEHIAITEVVTMSAPTVAAFVGCVLATAGAVFFVREPVNWETRP